MDKENQISTLCHACGSEREYDEYHRLYASCKKSASIRCAKHYQKIEKNYSENLDYIEKTIKKNLSKAANQLTHTLKSYKIYIIKLIAQLKF